MGLHPSPLVGEGEGEGNLKIHFRDNYDIIFETWMRRELMYLSREVCRVFSTEPLQGILHIPSD